jgi:GH24 family phage-related lysozyme (muramidase)
MLCPYCRCEHTVYELPPGVYRICCGHCGRGPSEELDSYDVQSGNALYVWENWVRRKRKKMRKN